MIFVKFSNKYGFVSVINFLLICEKHLYLQLSIKLGIRSLILNLNTCAVNNFTGMLLFINSYKLLFKMIWQIWQCILGPEKIGNLNINFN